MQGPWPSAHERRFGNLLTRFVPAAPLIVLILAIFAVASSGQSQPEPSAGKAHLNEILAYIHTAWDSLTRSTSSCGAIADSKLSSAPVLYLPADFEEPPELDKMRHNC
jgi:alpha,alpha-trehalase